MTIPGNNADPAGTPDSGAGEQRGEKGAEQRIGTLVRQREEWKTRAESGDRRLQALEEKIEKWGNPAQDQGDPMHAASFADLTLDQVKGQYAEAIASQDGATATELMVEIQRRSSQAAASKSADTLRGEHQQSQYAASINQEIQTRFASDLSDRDGPVYRQAEQFAGYFQKQFGQNALNERPELQLLSLSMASLDAKTQSHQAEVERLQNEIAQLKENQGLQGDLRTASRMNDASASALKQNDIKGAFRNLGVVRSLSGQ